jgi:hypothetical protein
MSGSSRKAKETASFVQTKPLLTFLDFCFQYGESDSVFGGDGAGGAVDDGFVLTLGGATEALEAGAVDTVGAGAASRVGTVSGDDAEGVLRGTEEEVGEERGEEEADAAGFRRTVSDSFFTMSSRSISMG